MGLFHVNTVSKYVPRALFFGAASAVLGKVAAIALSALGFSTLAAATITLSGLVAIGLIGVAGVLLLGFVSQRFCSGFKNGFSINN